MRLIYILVGLSLFGCTRGTEFDPVYSVPEDIQPIVDRFISEAAARGHAFHITNLIITYDETLTSPYCGQCNSSSRDKDVQKTITINPNMQCWFSPEEEEAFFFHELGHCLLGRLHDNSLLPNGDAKSMMIENNLAIYAPCFYPVGEEPCNNTFKRPYYLDELFDENTGVPDWGM